MRPLIAVFVAVWAAAVGHAATLSGVFTPTAVNDTLHLEIGAFDTSGFGDQGAIGPGVHLVSFRLSVPAETYLQLDRVDVEDDYDADGHPVGGDEADHIVYDDSAFTGTGRVLLKIPRPFTTPFVEGITDHYAFGGALLEARFTGYGTPVAYEFRVDRIGDVPEPAAWTGFVVGFGLVGTAVRLRGSVRGARSSRRRSARGGE